MYVLMCILLFEIVFHECSHVLTYVNVCVCMCMLYHLDYCAENSLISYIEKPL